ncbi:MAG: T9SS type A sorting domain-containing protein [Chitinophagaceae bacterium]
MQRHLPNVSLLMRSLSALACICVLAGHVKSQCTVKTISKLQQVTSLGGVIDSKGYFTGLLRWLPADYNSNTTTKYPMIVSFAGLDAMGTGAPVSQEGGLCKIVSESGTSLASKIESGEISNNISGQTPYIYIIPQFRNYVGTPIDSLRHADEVEALLDYLVANYRVDITRIYLTGSSAGANIAMDYVASSLVRSQRIAGMALSSLCYRYAFVKNNNGFDVIADSQLPTWFVQCSIDNTCAYTEGSTNYPGVQIADDWVNGITAAGAAITPLYNRLVAGPPGGGTINYCHEYFPHDTWRTLYAPTYANAAGKNLYAWLYSYTRPDATLPVRMKDFSARLQNGRVYLHWTTLAETNNKSFTIERAGSNGQFSAIANVAGKGDADVTNAYEFVDEQPLVNLSYYRLVQTDIDGKKTAFEIKKIMNKGSLKQLLVVAPNPFTTELSAYLTLDKTQKITAVVTDLNGKQLSTVSAVYNEGTSEITIPATKLARGIYLLKVTGEGFSQTQKVVKQ